MADSDDIAAPNPGAPLPPESSAPQERMSERQFQFIERLLDRLDSTRTTFRFELWVYNLSCAAALALVVFATARSVFAGHAGPSELASYLTSGGLFAITARRVTHFLDEHIQTIRQVLTNILTPVQQSPAPIPQEGTR